MPKFNSVKEAVYYVCGKTEVGYQSSTDTIVDAVLLHLNDSKNWKCDHGDRLVDYPGCRCVVIDHNQRMRGNSYEDFSKNVLLYRLQYRKENGIIADCRTYQGQPRRDMKNDKKVKITLLGKLSAILDKVGEDEFSALLTEFHSLEQLQNAIGHVKEFGKHYELVTME